MMSYRVNLKSRLVKHTKELEQYRLNQLLDGEYDAKNAIWKFIRELEEQKLRTGEQCCFGCTFVGVNNMALMLKLQAMKAGEEAGIKSVTLLN